MGCLYWIRLPRAKSFRKWEDLGGWLILFTNLNLFAPAAFIHIDVADAALAVAMHPHDGGMVTTVRAQWMLGLWHKTDS
jgi:hypothetical protein